MLFRFSVSSVSSSQIQEHQMPIFPVLRNSEGVMQLSPMPNVRGPNIGLKREGAKCGIRPIRKLFDFMRKICKFYAWSRFWPNPDQSPFFSESRRLLVGSWKKLSGGRLFFQRCQSVGCKVCDPADWKIMRNWFNAKTAVFLCLINRGIFPELDAFWSAVERKGYRRVASFFVQRR